MPSHSSMPLMEYLYRALASKYGIEVETDNLPLLRARLYKARADAMDPDLIRLQFRPDPGNLDTRLWIIKGAEPDVSS